MTNINDFKTLGFIDDQERADESPKKLSSKDGDEVFLNSFVPIEKNKAEKPTEQTDIDFQKAKYNFAENELRSIVQTAQEKFSTIFQMVRDDGLTVDNANAVCKKLSWIIINFYKALALFPGVKKAFGLSDAEFNTCPKEALAYAVNRDSFRLEFFDRFTLLTVPKLFSNNYSRTVKNVRYYYFRDCLYGLFEHYYPQIPYHKYARIVVVSPELIENTNEELQTIINSLKGFFISSDEGRRLHIDLICSGKLPERTEIYIMDQSDYISFVEKNQELYSDNEQQPASD